MIALDKKNGFYNSWFSKKKGQWKQPVCSKALHIQIRDKTIVCNTVIVLIYSVELNQYNKFIQHEY